MRYSQVCLNHPSRLTSASFRLANGLRLNDHVTSSAIDLHWPPAEACIHYKLCMPAGTPCSHRDSTNIMYRSSSTCRRHAVRSFSLFVPCTRLLFGVRAFRVAAPNAWNQLPHVKNEVRRLCRRPSIHVGRPNTRIVSCG